MDKLSLYKNLKVVVTGSTGFKGSWLTAWLKELGADIMGMVSSFAKYKSPAKIKNVGYNYKPFEMKAKKHGNSPINKNIGQN